VTGPKDGAVVVGETASGGDSIGMVIMTVPVPGDVDDVLDGRHVRQDAVARGAWGETAAAKVCTNIIWRFIHSSLVGD
jgi:hypothetical protein